MNSIFNEQIIESIENRIVVAVIDALVKDGKIGGSWMVRNKENKNLLSNHLYYKDWIDNTSESAKVVVLLELITIFEETS